MTEEQIKDLKEITTKIFTSKDDPFMLGYNIAKLTNIVQEMENELLSKKTSESKKITSDNYEGLGG